jgi:hypothetical protein
MDVPRWPDTAARLDYNRPPAVRITGDCLEPVDEDNLIGPNSGPPAMVPFVLQVEADGRTFMQCPVGTWRVFPQFCYDSALTESWVWMPVLRGRGLAYSNAGWLVGAPDLWGSTDPIVDMHRFASFARSSAAGEWDEVAGRRCVHYRLRHELHEEERRVAEESRRGFGPRQFDVWVDAELPLILRVDRDGDTLAFADTVTLDPPAFAAGPVELTRFPIGNHYDIPSVNPVPSWITDELASMLPCWLVERVVVLSADYRFYQASVSLPDRETALVVTKGPIDAPENLTRMVPFRVWRDEPEGVLWTVLGSVNDSPVREMLETWFSQNVK